MRFREDESNPLANVKYAYRQNLLLCNRSHGSGRPSAQFYIELREVYRSRVSDFKNQAFSFSFRVRAVTEISLLPSMM